MNRLNTKRFDLKQLRRLPQRLRALFGGAKAESEMDREIAAHLAFLEEEMVSRGATPAEARRLARLRMGGVEQTRGMHREERGLPLLESLIADVRFGWRQLMKRKVTTTAAVLSLALAMGACLAAFRLVDALFLRPLPITHPERLHLVQFSGMDEMGKAETNDVGGFPQLDALRKAVQGQAEVLGATDIYSVDLRWSGASERVAAQYVSGGMFAAFGLRPALGRLLTAEDDREYRSGPYVVLAYDFWQRRFAGDAAVIGKTLHVGQETVEVVGVAPKEFRGTQPGKMAEVFLPLTMNPNMKLGDGQWFRMFVMAAPGVERKTLEDRLAAADHAARSGIVEHRQTQHYGQLSLDLFLNQTLMLLPASTGSSRLQLNYGSSLLALSALAGMVLLIACVNVANLMAGLAAARSREMAVRISLGAGRARLLRLVMLESAMVGLAAAALGTLFASWAAPFVVGRLAVPRSPVQLALDADTRVLVFSGMLTVLVTMLFGLAPALRSAHVAPASVLKGGGERPTGLRWLHGMVAMQVAFCTLVLFTAGLFVSSFAGLVWKPLGFSPERIALIDVSAQNAEPLATWQGRMEQMRAVPGVERVSMSTDAMLSGGWMTRLIEVPGQDGGHAPVYEAHIMPGWLDTMQIPLLAGRDLRQEDTASDSALVNETFAREYFHGSNPVGKKFSWAVRDPANKPSLEIVGLIHDAAYSDLHTPVQPTIYLPLRVGVGPGEIAKLHGGVLTVRTSGDPAAMLERLRETVGQMAGVQGLRPATQESLVRDQLLRERLLATLAGFFAGVALLLAAVGLYGVLHYSVVQREREFGIRIALGAAAGNIARIVSVRVLAMVFLGAVVGLGCGVASVRFVSSLLYGVKATDVSMLLTPAVVLLCAAACAAVPVVLRAVRIDPVEMLRAE